MGLLVFPIGGHPLLPVDPVRLGKVEQGAGGHGDDQLVLDVIGHVNRSVRAGFAGGG